jgi:dCTP deaminase (dUMP-forming)
MILTDNEIINLVENEKIIIEPFIESNVGPSSYDVTLSNNFVTYDTQLLNPKEEVQYQSFNIAIDKCVILVPPHFNVCYDDEGYLYFKNESYEKDIIIDANQINLDIINGGYAIFSSLLGSTNEYIELPSNISAEYTGRSSLGRLFLQSHQTAGWIDAGFKGTITLELFALDQPIILYPGMKVGQLIFYEHNNNCSVPYCRKKSAKYNNQIGAIPSRMYLDF